MISFQFLNLHKNFVLILHHIFKYVFNKKDAILYIKAFIWSFRVRYWMLYRPFNKYKTHLGKMQVESDTNYDLNKAYIDQVKTIVLRVCRHTPWESKCLVQAVTCKKILASKGILSNLYLGVQPKHESKEMKAHAWLVIGEKVITGGPNHTQFKVVNFFG